MSTLELKFDEKTSHILRAAGGREGNKTLKVIKVLRRHPEGKRPEVFAGRIGPSGEDPGTKVAFKFASGLATIAFLEYEHFFYSQQLVHLQGTVIPRCYGLFKGAIYNSPVGCLVFEMCEETPLPVGEDIAKDHDEFIRKFMIGLCQIHQAGVTHHFLSSMNHVVRQGREPRIIDFSLSTNHDCAGATPAAKECGKINPGIRTRACPELVMLEETIGITNGSRRPVASVQSFSTFVVNMCIGTSR